MPHDSPAPDSVKRLVDARDMTEMSDISDRVPSRADRNVFLSPDYKEEQLRLEFLNPLLTALGWDMDNKQGLSIIRSRARWNHVGVSSGEERWN
jgi:hypothetical protein